MERGFVVVPLVFLISWFVSPYCESKLVEDEVATLEQIVRTLGSKYWVFNDTSCQVDMVGLSTHPPTASNSSIDCNCQFANGSCHVVGIVLKGFSLPGTLPPELAKLPYLRYIDFAYNCLSGGIPKEWASLQLEKISLIVNRLSGEFPKFLGDMTSLTYLILETNQFSGDLPAELGNLTNLESLVLSSNQFVGTLPPTLERLRNLTDFRINDNNFSGEIPSLLFRSWRQLQRLEMHASGLEGPIPSEISYLERLTRLRISDINGTTETIPMLRKMTGLEILVLRNCNIYGKIPSYLWEMENLQLLDLSFNKLVGKIASDMTAKYLKVIYLSGNSLTGNIPSTMLNSGMNIDLSYNNFTWQNQNQPSCQKDLNLNINLFRSSSTNNILRGFLPCLDRVNCPRYGCSFHINCGGDDLVIKGDEGKVIYEGDTSAPAGNAIYFKQSGSNWGFSSFGDFMDDNNHQNIRHITTLSSTSSPSLYTTSRLTPISLAYFGYCLETGNYTVTLHFAEIQFTNDSTYSSLGRRIFDIFIQDQLVEKNFNMEDEAHGVQKPLMKQYIASVTDGSLEIRFYWAGKGTTRIPIRGVYGPLISAISVSSDFRHCSNDAKGRMLYIILGAAGLSVVISVSFILWWRYYMVYRRKAEDHSRAEIQKGGYSLEQLQHATDNFSFVNKLGEGGFGTVYKGLLPNGSIIAVKQLSSSSKQGNRQFLNEIAMISCLQHPNLVKLHGCCTEGDELLLVYEYMENNSLASSLFGSESEGCILDWPTRVKIMLGVARGLAFLNEESRLKIVHRDIKATNVLLDRDFNAKISDFGLAKLGDEDKTHISTRVAGTIGYIAPEYALWGYLTNKADVYSFGILALEIISGKSNNYFSPPGDFFCLLDWACNLQQRGNYRDFVDDKLGSEANMEEAERMMKVALLCTNGSPSMRPAMSEVVRMLEGDSEVPEAISQAGTFSDDLRLKAMRDIFKHREEDESKSLLYQNSTTTLTVAAASSSFSASVSNTIHLSN